MNHPPQGPWTVSTEISEEGRQQVLGHFYGYIDEIAFALDHERFYTLEFEPLLIDNASSLPVRATKSVVRVPNDTRHPWFDGRPITSIAAGGYKCFTITSTDSDLANRCKEAKGRLLMEKLTQDDIEALRYVLRKDEPGEGT